MPFDQGKADRAVAFFNQLRHVDGQFFNQPFELLPWQEKIIRDVYGTVNEDGTRQYRTVWVELPKKNGKSELGAGAALYGMFADGEINGEVYGCAADKKQAGIIYKVASKMVDLVPALAKRTRKRDSTKILEDKVSGTFYEVLSAEAYTKHGFKPSAIIFDEIHAQPNADLWNVMTFGSGASRLQQLIWVLTTAGDDPDRTSIGWELHDKALRILNGDEVDPTWYVAIYAYDGDDIYNEDNWHVANPSLGVTKSIESMRAEAEQAKISPGQEKLFRWLHLNQWVTSKLSSWIPLQYFDQTTDPSVTLEMLIGKDCYIGQDASTTTDLSALAALFPPQEGLPNGYIRWKAWIPEESMQERIRLDGVPYDRWADKGWVIPTPGNTIDHWKILDQAVEWHEQYHVIELVSDPAFAVMLMQAEIKAGINVVTLQGTFANTTDPMNELETRFLSGKIAHEENELARWAFGNMAVAVNGSGLKKPVKESKGRTVLRTKRIDPMVATILAMARAIHYKAGQPADLSEAIKAEDWGM